MNIRDNREISRFAAQRVADTPAHKKIAAIYSGLILGMAALVSVVNYILGIQIDNFGGLSNLGTRTVLSSIQTMLPLAQSVITMCLELGFLAAMLRIARGQYVSPNTLRLGLDRFWVLLRCTIFKNMLILANVFLGTYLGVMLFAMTPWSKPAMEVLSPYLSQLTVMDSTLVLEEGVYAEFAATLLPAYAICAVTIGLFTVPAVYSYRMAFYILIDRPGMGALAALRESKRMMRHNRVALFKLDLRLWWYYAALLGATVLCYGDVILPMLGMELPLSGDAGYFLFFAAYLAALFAVYYFLRSRAEVAYCLAYDALRPQEKQDNGVVLGNIFDM